MHSPSDNPPAPSPAGPPAHDPLELRGTPRVGTDFAASIYTGEWRGGLPARTRDIGVGGACLATPSPFAIKSIERVVLDLPGHAAGPVAVAAEGRWQRDEAGEGVVLTGVEFVSPSPEAQEALWRQVLEAGYELARFLQQSSALHELGVEDAMGLAQLTRRREVPVGRTIYRQGHCEAGEDSLLLVVRGEVALQLRIRDALERDVARLGPGEMFGGLPLVTGEVQADSAVAASDCELLEIDRSAWHYLRTARPWLGQRLGHALLRVTAARLRRLVEESARCL